MLIGCSDRKDSEPVAPSGASMPPPVAVAAKGMPETPPAQLAERSPTKAAERPEAVDHSDIADMSPGQIRAEMVRIQDEIMEVAHQTAEINVRMGRIQAAAQDAEAVDPRLKAEIAGLENKFAALREEYGQRLEVLPGVGELTAQRNAINAERMAINEQNFALLESLRQADEVVADPEDPRRIAFMERAQRADALAAQITGLNAKIQAIKQDAWDHDAEISAMKSALIEQQYRLAALRNEALGLDGIIAERNAMDRRSRMLHERLKRLDDTLFEIEDQIPAAGSGAALPKELDEG